MTSNLTLPVPDHAAGRRSSIAVRRYLEALERRNTRPGRHRSLASILDRLAAIDEELIRNDLAPAGPDRVVRLRLLQEQLTLEQHRQGLRRRQDFLVLEAGFVEHAARFSAPRGISYAAWREAGVPAGVLRQAGLHP